VIGEDLRQRGLVFRLQQRVDCSCGKSSERFVRRRENRERTRPLQCVDQSACFHGGHEGRVIGRVHGIVDNVHILHHRLTADHRVRHRRGARRCQRERSAK